MVNSLTQQSTMALTQLHPPEDRVEIWWHTSPHYTSQVSGTPKSLAAHKLQSPHVYITDTVKGPARRRSRPGEVWGRKGVRVFPVLSFQVFISLPLAAFRSRRLPPLRHCYLQSPRRNRPRRRTGSSELPRPLARLPLRLQTSDAPG